MCDKKKLDQEYDEYMRRRQELRAADMRLEIEQVLLEKPYLLSFVRELLLMRPEHRTEVIEFTYNLLERKVLGKEGEGTNNGKFHRLEG